MHLSEWQRSFLPMTTKKKVQRLEVGGCRVSRLCCGRSAIMANAARIEREREREMEKRRHAESVTHALSSVPFARKGNVDESLCAYTLMCVCV